MTTNDQSITATKQTSKGSLKTNWLSPRRKRFWLMLTVFLYLILGFFAAPVLIRNSVTTLLQEDLGRTVSIEQIKVNPIALSFDIKGFQVIDTDGEKLASFDNFYVNFQFLSFLKWAWTFSQVQLTGPYLNFERFDTGESRPGHLLADFSKLQNAQPDPEPQVDQANDIPRILIRNLELKDGHVDFKDRLPETPVELQLQPINISIQELNTLPDIHGQQSVTIQLPDNARLKWSGSLALAPLESRGTLLLEGLHIDPAIAYLESLLPLDAISASLSSDFEYHLSLDQSGAPKFDISKLNVILDDLLVSGLSPATEFIDIPEISMLDGKFLFPENSLHFGKVSIDSPSIKTWIKPDGNINVLELVPADSGQPASADNKPQQPWQFGVGEFTLANGQLFFSDQSIQPNASIHLSELELKLSGFSNAANILMPFEFSARLPENGRLKANADIGVLPELSVSGDVSTETIPLSLGQAYIQQFAHIILESGKLDSTLQVKKPAGQPLAVSGAVTISDLKIKDTLNNESLVGWEKLDIDQFDLGAESLHVSQMIFDQAYGRLAIHQDQSTNLTDLVVEQTASAASEAEPDPFNIIIGGIQLNNAVLDFSDDSLPLPFATHITGLDGTVSTISTNTTAPASLKMEGQVDEFGLARIEGGINILDPFNQTDISLEFRNLLMSNLSPYTVAFAGRKIDKGKMNLGLIYAITDGQLHGENDIVLNDLELGEKIDHPDAASLPLGLAVSLLKDSDGVIKIDLPVEGDMNDPEFRIGGIVWQAFTGLISKIATSPFRLLGNLVGIDSEDFGQFEFLAGRSDLTPPELEKITQLEQALQQRPELNFEIGGVTDPAIDVPALKSIRLRKIAGERLNKALEDQQDQVMMLDEEIRATVETLFAERFPDTPLQPIKAEHMSPPANKPDGEPVLDELAFARDLWNQLLGTEVISDKNLEDLAMARAQAIRTAFLTSGQINDERVIIVDSKESASEDGEWVKMELSVASD